MQVAVNMFSLRNVVLALSAHDQLLARCCDIGFFVCGQWLLHELGWGHGLGEGVGSSGLRIK